MNQYMSDSNKDLPNRPPLARIPSEHQLKGRTSIDEMPLIVVESTKRQKKTISKKRQSESKGKIKGDTEIDLGGQGKTRISDIGNQYQVNQSVENMDPDHSGFDIYEVPDETKVGDQTGGFQKIEKEEELALGAHDSVRLIDDENVDLFITKEEQAFMDKQSQRVSHKIIIDSDLFNAFINIFTIFSIFADDWKKWMWGTPVDFWFDLITIGTKKFSLNY